MIVQMVVMNKHVLIAHLNKALVNGTILVLVLLLGYVIKARMLDQHLPDQLSIVSFNFVHSL
jgi:hypothetical protein